MANNFFLSQDPLLYQSSSYQRPIDSEADLQKQFNDTIAQYKMYQQQQQQNQANNNVASYDYISELDKQIKAIPQDAVNELNTNEEYVKLNNELTELVQKEILNNIKWRINTNNSAIQNINRQIEIINSVKKNVDDEQRKNMSELNDYVKNYSNITFDEYKRIKNGELSQQQTDNNKTKKKKL